MGSFGDTLIRCFRIIVDLLTAIYAAIFWPDQKGQIPHFTERLLLKPAIELVDLIRKQEVTAEEVMRAYIRRIREVNPLINAVIDERFAEAIEEAKLVDKRVEEELSGERNKSYPSIYQQPLLGVPFTCKDSFKVKGQKLVVGLPQRKDYVSDEDAACIQNLRNAGAIPVAMGNVPEMLLWWTADNKVFGRTNNPYDLSRIAGGSSGGDCSLLSSGGAIISVGSDVGGSIRIPCCMCGVFGHKTTSKVISCKGKWPPNPEGRLRYFAVGPMTRFACDLKPMLKAMAGEDIKKLPKIDDPVDFSRLTIYYMLDDEDPLKTRVRPQIKEAILRAVFHFNKRYRTKTKEVCFRDFRYVTKIFLASMAAVGGDPMIKMINSGLEGDLNVYTTFLKSFLGFGPHTRHVTLFSLLSHHLPPLNSKWMKDGLAMRDKLTSEVESLLGDNGVFILPSYPEPAPKHGTTIPKNTNIGYFTMLNLLGLPATQIPIGLSEEGIPLGIQVATTKFNDHITLEMACELEKEFGGWIPPAPYINHEVPK